jgi:putative hemolysin
LDNIFWGQFIALWLLILGSAFFSGAEVALISLSKVKLKAILENNNSDPKLKIWLHHPNRILTTILIGNNLANLLAASLATIMAIELLGDKINHSLAGLISTSIITVIIVVAGEIIPKIIAREKSEKIAAKVIGTLNVISILLYPVVQLLTKLANGIIKLIGGRPRPFLTEEEMLSMIKVGEEEGVLEKEEQEMIHSIFEFGDTKVREVMVPRTDMVRINAKTPLNEVTALLIKYGFSRIPIYDNIIDNIIGIIYVKDALNFYNQPVEKREVCARDFMHEPYFVPETKMVNDLLKEFRKKKIHMAIVLDEYGGTAGLVTLEDLIEEIIGEISDEYDKSIPNIELTENNVAIVNASTNIKEVNETFETNIPEEAGLESIGGFILGILGRFPKKEESFNYKNLYITILECTRTRLLKLRLEKKKEGGKETVPSPKS